MIELLLFFGLALVAVVSALGMLLSKNAIYSALYLILNFITVAVFYLLLEAPFIALSQITVYTGAIMVLFLFVIMLLGAERLPGEPIFPWQRPVSFALAAILLAEVIYILVTRRGTITAFGGLGEGYGTPQQISLTLFLDYLLPFEIISVLLLVAIVGVVVLNRRRDQLK